MRSFAYTAYTLEGRARRGTVVAEDEADAAGRLQAMGLLPSDIRAAQPPRRGGWRDRRLDADLLSVFTRQMAVLLGAGLTADAALGAVQGSASAPRIERLASGARAALAEGAPLAEALEQGGGALPPWYAAAVRAGEGSGELDAVFDTLAEQLERSAGERAAITSALVYPAFVTLVAIVVCAILMTNVAPEIVGLFEDAGRPLPPLTVAVMGVVDAVRAHWLALSVAGLTLLGAIIAINRNRALRARRDTILLRVPLVGRFLRMGTAAQYLRTLAVVLNSRLPATEALRHAAQVVTIAPFRTQAEAAGAAIQRGESLTDALGRLHFLHPVARQLIQAGENSARLGPMTDRAAVLAESWLARERKRLIVVIEPLSMIVVGALVLAVVMAILLPIFDMQALVGG